MKQLTIYLFSIMLLLNACSKKDDFQYLEETLSDEGITLKVEGTVHDYQLDDVVILNYYDSFDHSKIYTFEDEGGGSALIRRRSKDGSSYMGISFRFDENKVLDPYSIQIDFSFVADINDKVTIDIQSSYFSTRIQNLVIEQVSYNYDTGDTSFNFSFLSSGAEQNCNISGSVNVKLFEILEVYRY